MIDEKELMEGLVRVCERADLSSPSGLTRLTGGATMESWRFSAGEDDFVLRRAPSLEFMADRPFGHDVEAAVICAARSVGVCAPEVVIELEPKDGIGSGFVMRALPGTADPKAILPTDEPDRLLSECAANLAKIHSLGPEDLPDAVPVMDTCEAIADLRAQFEEAGGDRPIIALGLKWMEDNCPPQAPEPVLIHGDYRLGNLLVENGWLTGVLDWELAHLGDYHEDLAFGCMAVWRFARYDRPALGLGDLETYFDAYEANGGRPVDRERFRYWLVHRTVWWALGCLKMAQHWRSGQDRMLERVVISRRTSEQELDLLMLLEEEAPMVERMRHVYPPSPLEHLSGEAAMGEIAQAVAEWLLSIRDKLSGYDRFQLAVARNALGMIQREQEYFPLGTDEETSKAFLSGVLSLDEPGQLQALREQALQKTMVDVPKYPALAVALKKWAPSEEDLA